MGSRSHPREAAIKTSTEKTIHSEWKKLLYGTSLKLLEEKHTAPGWQKKQPKIIGKYIPKQNKLCT